MIKPNFHRKEAPAIAVVGSMIGGYIGGGMTLAGMASVGGIIGSMVGGAVASSLVSQSAPDYPTSQVPGMPGTGAMPQPGQVAQPTADINATAGNASTPTGEQINKDQTDSMKRRGRLSTILSGRQAAGGDTNELLGG